MPVSERCRVEQVAVSNEHAALPSRLRPQGQVVHGRHKRLNVRFDGDDQLISLQPPLVRMLDAALGGC